MCLRIQRSRATVKELRSRLQHAYQRDDVRGVRRITVVLDLLVPQGPVEVLRARWGLSFSCLYHWRQTLLLRGMDSLVYHPSGGRRPTLPPRQQQRLAELLEAGPQVVGCETACWTAVLMRVLSWRECGVRYNGQYVCTWLHNVGVSFQKARGVSDHLDAARRPAWLQEDWPRLLRAATRRQGLILFEDEASFAPWGALSDTWARRGQQPEVHTSGKRTGDKVFGAIESFAGRWFSQGIAGRCASASYHAFLRHRLAQTTAHLFLIHEGTRYHTSQATAQFLAQHAARLTGCPLPSYSPDSPPIDYLWKKTKKRATHHQSFKELALLTGSVEQALAYCAPHPETV